MPADIPIPHSPRITKFLSLIPVKDAYIAAKERWARKNAGQSPRPERTTARLPPGQRLVTDFPVLDLGVQPEIPIESWSLRIHGHVEKPVTLDWQKFRNLPPFRDTSDFHCVTTWSQFDMAWEGVAFFTLADLVQPKPSATHVYFRASDGYTTNNSLEVLLDDDVLVAHSWNGQPLSREHGGPARVIIPKRYAWKGAKWVKEMIFLDRDLRGFWELRGYSNTADPWTDDRFSEPATS